MSDLTFRIAKAEDFDVLFSAYREIVEVLEKRNFDETFYRRMLESAIQGERSLVCEKDGQVIGFIEFNPICPDLPLLRENCLWVDWSWVREDFRGQGLGRKLYEALFNHARLKGFARVACDVFTVNESSQAFHQKVGFTEKIRIYTKDV